MDKNTVVVRNVLTGEVGEIRRRLFNSPVFNPDGLLVESEDTRSGCVDCGVEPAEPVVEYDEAEDPETLEDPEEEEN